MKQNNLFRSLIRCGRVTAVMCAVLFLKTSVCDAVPLRSFPIVIGWDASPDPGVKGYAVYYGPTNQPATNRMDIGRGQRITFTNLQADVNYAFYAVSYHANGAESLPSNAIRIRPAPLSRAELKRDFTRWRIALKAAPGSVCRVEYADAATGATWRTLTNVTATSLGEVIAYDTTPTRQARFYRTALVTAPPPATRLQLARLPNGSMRINLNGSPSVAWRIQRAATPNSTLWTTVATVTNSIVGTATFTDTTAAQSASRFYRAVTP
jgi:hypothetical protein